METQRTSIRWATLACVLALLGIVVPFGALVELFQSPVGSAIRPMGLSGGIFFAAAMAVSTLPLSVLAMLRGGIGRLLGFVAMLVSIATPAVYVVLSRWIIDAHELIIKP